MIIFLYRRHKLGLIMDNLSGKFVLVTGCDSGFGNQFANQLDRRGMRVLATCLTQKGAEDLKKTASSRLQTVILDVSNTQSVSSVATWVSDVVGDNGQFDIIV